MSVFHDVIADGLDALADVVGDAVKYHRGNASCDLEFAVQGSSQWQAAGTDEVAVEFSSVDFLLKATELVISGQAVLPKRGDYITRTVAGRTFTYDVMPDAGATPYRWIDRGRTRIRVHCKERS